MQYPKMRISVNSVIFIMQMSWVLCNAQDEIGVITGVRLVNGSTQYEGTVEVTEDGVTWQTVCGESLGFGDAIVICRHLNYTGANRNIANSPFGTNMAPGVAIQCYPDTQTLADCLSHQCSSPSSDTSAGAVKCYDDRYLGCYRDSTINRVLPDGPCIMPHGCLLDNLTVDHCIEHCQSVTGTDYAFAGVEYGIECFCGYSDTNFSRLGRRQDHQCAYQCAGDMYESCGGIGSIAVFDIFMAHSSQASVSLRTTGEIQQIKTTSKDTTTEASTTIEIKQSKTTTKGTTTGASGMDWTQTLTLPLRQLSTIFSTSTISHISTEYPQCQCHGAGLAFGLMFGLLSIYAIVLSVIHVRLRRSHANLNMANEGEVELRNYEDVQPTIPHIYEKGVELQDYENQKHIVPEEPVYLDILDEEAQSEDWQQIYEINIPSDSRGQRDAPQSDPCKSDMRFDDRREYDEQSATPQRDEQYKTLQNDEQFKTLQHDERSDILQHDEQTENLQHDIKSATLQHDEQSASLQLDKKSATLQHDQQSATLQKDEQSETVQDEQSEILQHDKQSVTLQNDEQYATTEHHEQTANMQNEEQSATLQHDEQSATQQYEEPETLQHVEQSETLQHVEQSETLQHDEQPETLQHDEKYETIQHEEQFDIPEYSGNYELPDCDAQDYEITICAMYPLQ